MIVGIVVYRYVQRRRFMAELRGLRLEPEQLLGMMELARKGGIEAPFIIDLRHPLDVLTAPEVLPGALRIGPDELRMHRDEIPDDREIVLYCTCPSEETSAKVAMELRRLGVHARASAARRTAGMEGCGLSAGIRAGESAADGD